MVREKLPVLRGNSFHVHHVIGYQQETAEGMILTDHAKKSRSKWVHIITASHASTNKQGAILFLEIWQLHLSGPTDQYKGGISNQSLEMTLRFTTLVKTRWLQGGLQLA